MAAVMTLRVTASGSGMCGLKKLTLFPMCGFTAQLVEHRTVVAEVTGSNLVEGLLVLRIFPSNCLSCKIYCDDHCSLTSTTKNSESNVVAPCILLFRQHVAGTNFK